MNTFRVAYKVKSDIHATQGTKVEARSKDHAKELVREQIGSKLAGIMFVKSLK